jgi:hypothetical protein
LDALDDPVAALKVERLPHPKLTACRRGCVSCAASGNGGGANPERPEELGALVADKRAASSQLLADATEEPAPRGMRGPAATPAPEAGHLERA